MLGSIAGDIIGSRFEFMATQEIMEFDYEFFHPACSFTDDTVCLSSITTTSLFAYEHNKFNNNLKEKYFDDYIKEVKFNKEKFYSLKYTEQLILYFNQFYMAGYGQRFSMWCKAEKREPYESLGNGCLMRISSIPFIFDTLEECLMFNDFATNITHNHPVSIKMTHLYIEILWFLLHSKDELNTKKKFIIELCEKYSLKLDTVENYHKIAGFNVLVHETIQRSIVSSLEANSFKETIQNVLYIGSDTDTTGCIAGAISELLYGIDNSWIKLLIKKFDFKSIVLLQNIIPIYKQKESYSSHIKEVIFNESKIQIYNEINGLKLTDPTAEWDPLEMPEDYYSECDKKLQEKQRRENSYWFRIMNFFSDKSN